MSGPKQRTDLTSAGVPWSDVPDYAIHDVEWMDGRHGPATDTLPSLDEVPIPPVLDTLPRLHPKRPTGSKAMLDAHGARSRLGRARAGAWLISPLTGNWFAKRPDGFVGWVPKGTELPEALRVGNRNDLH